MPDTSLYHALIVAASMGLAILASPEILVVGLLVAANRTSPRLNTLIAFCGAVVGLAVIVAIGAWITPTVTDDSDSPSLHRAILKCVIGSALIMLGIFRGWQFISATTRTSAATQPISDSPSSFKKFLETLFPSISEKVGASKSAPIHYFLSSFAIGFISMGLNPKVLPFATMIGHTFILDRSVPTRAATLIVFGALAIVPWSLPLCLTIAHPTAAFTLKNKFEIVLQRHGNWIASLICFTFGVHLLWASNAIWPR